MKLKELLNSMNENLKTVENKKYNDGNELEYILETPLKDIKTELGELIVSNMFYVRLIKEKDINVSGAGKVLFNVVKSFKHDKRVKYGTKGIVISARAELNKELPEELLEFELKDLQAYFDEVDRINEIKWYDSEIARYEKKIERYKKERAKLMNNNIDREVDAR